MSSYHIDVRFGSKNVYFNLIHPMENVESDKTVIIDGMKYKVIHEPGDEELIKAMLGRVSGQDIKEPNHLSSFIAGCSGFNTSTTVSRISLDRLSENFSSLMSSSSASQVNLRSDKSIDDTIEINSLDTDHQYIQIRVLNQLSDGTGHGVENCGYHALKNAIAAQSPTGKSKKAAQDCLRKPELFLLFFRRYCSPLIPLDVVDKDASIPRLYEIIEKFLQDKEPPGALEPFQEVLKENMDRLVMLNMSTSTDPFLAFVGEDGLEQFVKITNFINNPESNEITFIFGNQNEGHWFTIKVEKTMSGNFKFSCFDSFEQNHSRAGKESPFIKATESLLLLFKAPQKAAENAIFDLNEMLERKAALLGESSEFVLLADKESILRQCMACYQYMKSNEWIAQDDIRKQGCFTTIEKLLTFYNAKEVNRHHTAVLDEIQRGRKATWMVEILDTVIGEVCEYAAALDSPLKSQAMNTAELGTWLKKLYLTRKDIRDSTALQQKLKLEMSIEDNFSEDPVKEIERNVFLYILTIQTAKQKDRYDEVLKEIGSPACFTGRMGAVSDFLPRLQWEDLDQVAIAGYTFLTTDVAFSDAIMESSLLEGEEDDNARKIIADFTIDQSKAEIDLFVDALKKYGNSERAQPFLDFLIREGIEDSLPVQDWRLVVEKLMASKFFPEILSRAKTEALRVWI